MNLLFPAINLFFGVAAAMLISLLLGAGGDPVYKISCELLVGIIVGMWSTLRMRSFAAGKVVNLKNVFFINMSLWFGISVGLIAGMLVMLFVVFVVFSQIFGHPELQDWPRLAGLMFELLLVFVPLISVALLGNWCIKNSLNFVMKQQV